VTICPCCGFKSSVLTAALSEGCASCGARSVGDPLPRPDHELPSYGRSLVLAVTGTLMVLVFAAQTVMSLVERVPLSEGFYAAGVGALDYRPWLAAAETAAWRLKWVMIPMTIVVLWGCRRLYRSVQQSPTRFCGLRYARRGYLASAFIPLLILILIGVTVPERLQQREDAVEAGFKALGYASDRVFLQYRDEFGTIPSEVKDLERLPDPDGSIAALLKEIETAGYKPGADLAAVPTKKPQPLRGAVILNASIGGDDTPSERLSFTNYELILPGADKLLGTEDDFIVRDGLIKKASETPRRLGSTTASSQTVKP
jgi:hypothetical protein